MGTFDQIRLAPSPSGGLRSGASQSISARSAIEAPNPDPSSLEPSQGQAPAPGDGAPARITADGFYISPNLAFDARSSTVIFQIRDASSGDVTRQFPAETVVERYRRDPSQAPFVLPEPAEDAGPVTSRAEDAAGSEPTPIETAFGRPVTSGVQQTAGGANVDVGTPAPSPDTNVDARSISPRPGSLDILA
jgi:hypothetical protein